MTVPPSPDAPLVFSNHARRRLRERVGGPDQDAASVEIREAIRIGCLVPTGRNMWAARLSSRSPRYVLARQRDGKVVVVTVLTAMMGVRAA